MSDIAEAVPEVTEPDEGIACDWACLAQRIEAARAEERERCALLVESQPTTVVYSAGPGGTAVAIQPVGLAEVASLIRAMSDRTNRSEETR